MSDQKFAGDYPAGTEQAYRAYWATMTGRSPADIYVPEALLDGFVARMEAQK